MTGNGRSGVTQSVWGELSLGVGEAAHFALGELELRLRRRTDEVWMHACHEVSAPIETASVSRAQDEGSSEGTDAEAWIRWALRADEGLALRPALPDRPVVVSPEQPFFLPPEGRARVFVRIPLFVQVRTTGDSSPGATLEEFPSVVLSDTWWGSFTEGEVGYWLGTRARREMTPDLYSPHLAVCPFVLVNRSDQPLPVERFAVRVAYLTLFGRGQSVWTDEVQVRYRGGSDGSEIRYTGNVPEDAGEVSRLADSREPAPRGFNARTFGRLKARMAAL